MPAFPTEIERIRESVERIDRRAKDSGDRERAFHKALEEQHRERLSIAREVVISQDRVHECVSDFRDEVQSLGSALGELASVTESGLQEVADSIDSLGPLFEWGFDEIICQLGLQRKDLQQILHTLQAPLDTQAKELRNRGLEALRNGWYEEALRDLFISEEKNYRDFTVHRAIGSVLVRKEDWTAARAYYEKSAKYAEPYSARDTAEAHLGASLACRQQQDLLAAYGHTEAAIRSSPNLLQAHYEHAINAVWLSQLPPADRSPQALVQEAVETLRKVLWTDEEYSVRLDTEPLFEPAREQCNNLLENLRADLEREADGWLSKIDVTIAEAEAVCTPTRFAAIAARALQRRVFLRKLHGRNSILDYLEIRSQAPLLERYINYVRDLVHRVDVQTPRVNAAYNTARTVVGPSYWGSVGSSVEQEMVSLRELHAGDTVSCYEDLEKRGPQVEASFYQFAQQRLGVLHGIIGYYLNAARSEASRLNSDAYDKESKAGQAPFGFGTGCLIWLAAYLGLAVLLGVAFGSGGVGIAILVSIVFVLVLYFGVKGQRRAQAEEARSRVSFQEATEIRPMENMLRQTDAYIAKCQRHEGFELYEFFNRFLPEASSK